MPGGTDDLAFPDLDELHAAQVNATRVDLTALDEDHVRDLYGAAAGITTCPAEQTAVVVLAVVAGKGPEWVENYQSGRPRELGCLDRLLGAVETDPDALDPKLLIDEDGQPLAGRCGECCRNVDSTDPDHRVSSILRGGRGVECVRRGDIGPQHAGLLR